MRTSRFRASALLLLAAATGLAHASAQTLRFRVYLGDDPIGQHSFELRLGGSEQQVVSAARFDVDFLLLNVYRYRHESRERWEDGCLTEIRATTDDNGRAFSLVGERRGDDLTLAINGREKRLPACIGTFTYWDRERLGRPRLLNPQTGELVNARLEREGRDRWTFRGKDVEADRYRLNAGATDIVLWYTPSGDWIGLESETTGGRALRYERL
jgi:hypothetical protein